jgi:hypothetical protein
MSTLVLVAPGTPKADGRERRRDRRSWPIRAAIHLACWIPFVATAADSWRGPWRPVGDNARLALESWNTFSGWIPLVGQPNELPGAPHDLGPMQYWLLALPVHADAARGVLWGAVLLALLAVSLTVEAGYSVLGEKGAVLAGGVVIAIVTWFPGFATRPEDNPNFGMIFFIATLSVGLAILAGHRTWWPVLVVTASVAAQAHLTYAADGLVLGADRCWLPARRVSPRKDAEPAQRHADREDSRTTRTQGDGHDGARQSEGPRNLELVHRPLRKPSTSIKDSQVW